MPTYDYVCDACEHAFEEFQSMSAKPLRKCPECSKNKLRRLIGMGGAVIFKGSGFYETDYRSDSYEKGAKAEKDAAKPKTEAKTSDKKETKKKDAAKPKASGDKKPAKK